MRINKFLTHYGFCSRRKADELITQGKVRINEKKAVLGDQVQEADEVFVDGKQVQRKSVKVYLMYNKPKGVICTTDKREKDNIIDAIQYPERIFPIGRLDKDSTGLIFLTNDGDVVNKILRAQYGHEKEYIVSTSSEFDDAFLKKMSQGVDIGGYVTKSCQMKRVNKSTFSIILTEGKNRQIRRMCEALGQRVRHLNRVRIMNVELGLLKSGELQPIEQKKLDKLFGLIEQKSHLNTQDEIIEE